MFQANIRAPQTSNGAGSTNIFNKCGCEVQNIYKHKSALITFCLPFFKRIIYNTSFSKIHTPFHKQ